MTKRFAGGDAAAGLLANANHGGENVHRGAVLGVLLGAEAGAAGLDPTLVDGLFHADAIRREIDAAVAAVAPAAP